MVVLLCGNRRDEESLLSKGALIIGCDPASLFADSE
jgi:hypothetical protein